MPLQKYLIMFAKLKRANNAIFPDLSKCKAPHKPVLLLAVIDLIQQRVISSPVIDVTRDLVELNDLFNSYWQRVVPLGHSSSIAFPFSRLNGEPFWSLFSSDSKEVDARRLILTVSLNCAAMPAQHG